MPAPKMVVGRVTTGQLRAAPVYLFPLACPLIRNAIHATHQPADPMQGTTLDHAASVMNRRVILVLRPTRVRFATPFIMQNTIADSGWIARIVIVLQPVCRKAAR
ncbi:MAG TPA: hypothetical protein VMM84_15700 [Pyrinomonadaceae bacterium]|nr:hypothetical protein [Pyrinomonadaceae bacterium]